MVMSDREIREVLQEVIADIDAGRVDPRSPARRRRRRERPYLLGRWLGPPLLAASLGVAAAAGAGATGCTMRNVGVDEDASGDARVEVDGGNQELYGVVGPDAGLDAGVDGGNIDLYGVIVEDGGVAEDGGELEDAEVDAQILPPYASPPILEYDAPLPT
jgi:hypothetical protein